MSRAQSSLEFLLIFSFVFLMLSVLVLVYFDKEETHMSIEEDAQLQAAADKLARHANAVLAAGNGTNSTVRVVVALPYFAEGFDITFEPDLMRVDVKKYNPGITVGNSASSPILTSNMNYFGISCANPCSTIFTITNVNGRLTIT